MFSKSKINDPSAKPDAAAAEKPAAPINKPAAEFKPAAPKAKPPASVLSSDLHVTVNLKTTGDIQVEGRVDSDIRAHLLTIGEGATVKGEIIADDVVINGHVIGLPFILQKESNLRLYLQWKIIDSLRNLFSPFFKLK